MPAWGYQPGGENMDMEYLPRLDVTVLRNQYIGWRHGRSKANERGIIASGTEALTDWGLADIGWVQAKNSVSAAIDADWFPPDPVVLTSPLLRARETSGVGVETIGLRHAARVDNRLRERGFGNLNLHSDSKYPLVWTEDAKNPGHNAYNVESVIEVLDRMMAVVESCERAYVGRTVLLVSHGDPLQMLNTVFTGLPAAQHRSGHPIQTAELIRFNGSLKHC